MKQEKMIQKQLIQNMGITLIAFTVIFSILGIILYSQVKASMYQSADRELLNSRNRASSIRIIQPKLNLEKPVNLDRVNPRLIYLYRNEEGSILESEMIPSNYFTDIKFDKNVLEQIYDVTVENQYQYRAINYQINQDGKIVYVQMLINVDAEQAMLSNFKTTLMIGIIVCILLSILASYVVSKNTIKPIVVSWRKQSEFVQNASHELRTPLAIIQAKQELLWESPDARIMDKAEEIMISLSETKRLSKLVKDLMILARSDEGQIRIKKESFALDEWIEGTIVPYQELAQQQEKNFIVTLKYGKNLIADKEKIHELLVILLDNSMKYTKQGETIEIATYEKENKCYLEVNDTGSGISEEGIKRVFERFYREDKSHDRRTGGSGLGLSIAQEIVTLHHGTIQAKHYKPKGTSMVVVLEK